MRVQRFDCWCHVDTLLILFCATLCKRRVAAASDEAHPSLLGGFCGMLCNHSASAAAGGKQPPFLCSCPLQSHANAALQLLVTSNPPEGSGPGGSTPPEWTEEEAARCVLGEGAGNVYVCACVIPGQLPTRVDRRGSCQVRPITASKCVCVCARAHTRVHNPLITTVPCPSSSR
eukprot:1157494-Pelagomonas_calceolata.AAC.2